MKLFSRFPILDAQTVSPESTDIGGRYAVRFELVVDERTVIVYAAHPHTPRSTRRWRQRTAYLRDLERVLRDEPADTPGIVMLDVLVNRTGGSKGHTRASTVMPTPSSSTTCTVPGRLSADAATRPCDICHG